MPNQDVQSAAIVELKLLAMRTAAARGMSEEECLDLAMTIEDRFTLADRIDFIDVGETMRTQDMTPLPTTVGRIDGTTKCLFYAGGLHSVYGKPSSGKTLMMQRVVADEIERGNNVLWIDTEESDEMPIARRLHALGVDDELVSKHLTMVVLTKPLSNDGRGQLLNEIMNRDIKLVVLDSFGEFMGNQGRDEIQDKDVSWGYDFLEPLSSTGAAVVVIDHPNNATRWRPSGSKRKLARPWLAYALNVDCHDEEDDKSRSFSRERSGYTTITCTKDRHGTWSVNQQVAKMSVLPSGEQVIVDIEVSYNDELDDLVDAEPVPGRQLVAMSMTETEMLDRLTEEAQTMPLTAQYVKNLLHLPTKAAAEKLLETGRELGLWRWDKAVNGYVPWAMAR